MTESSKAGPANKTGPAHYDAAILGAGPAGLAAAVALAQAGASVALVDAGVQLGGQYYRQPAPALAARRPGRLHHHWQEFTHLADRCAQLQDAGLIRYLPRTEIWAVERLESESPGFRAHTTSARPGSFDCRALLLATGAYERQIPFPGWDLPGVMTAGGAQALLKESLIVPDGRVLVAGTGPLLLPVAAGLAAAGANVVGLYEANRYRAYLRTMKAMRTLAAQPAKLAEAAGYAAALARFRVPVRAGRAVIAAHGTSQLERVTVACLDNSGAAVPGTEKTIPCDTLAIGYGLVPQVEIGLELGCPHRICADATVALAVDNEQRTIVPGVWAAGEVTGVAGSTAALAAGQIAGLSMARQLAERPDLPQRLLRKRDRAVAMADLLLAAHPVPGGWPDRLTPDTLVCRCEQIPAGLITESLDDLGADDLRTVKLLTRAGMGWCQGRMCGLAVAALVERSRAAATGAANTSIPETPTPQAARDLLAAARRPIARPVPLGVLAERPEEFE